jgi:SAM-dependent methyltransferase
MPKRQWITRWDNTQGIIMEATATQWDEIFQRDGRVFFEPVPLVVQFAEMLKARGFVRVLDVGCGSGRHVVHMARTGLEVYGLDNSSAALRLTSEWLAEQAQTFRLVRSDARHPLPFRDSSFDALISTQVIHHAILSTVQATADEIARVVRPGGIILVSVPVGKDADDSFIEIEPRTFIPLSGSEKGLPHHIFTPEELPKLFAPFETLDVNVRGGGVIVYQGVKR